MPIALALVILLLVGIAAVVALVVRAAGGQGTESELMLRTHDQLSEQALVDELGDQANTGIEIDGRLADTTVPEPAGPPPVHGAQWDEHAGRWIHWDPATETWQPVPGGSS